MAAQACYSVERQRAGTATRRVPTSMWRLTTSDRPATLIQSICPDGEGIHLELLVFGRDRTLHLSFDPHLVEDEPETVAQVIDSLVVER